MSKLNNQRIMDLGVCLIVVIPLAVFLGFLMIFTAVFDGPPLLFIHRRIGKGGKDFVTYKLKTYAPIQTKDEYLIVDHKRAEERVTILGRMYRDHGWDELPQVFNILLGQMTFIGPRPLVEYTYEDLRRRYPEKAKLIEAWRQERLKILPGLTGWHQVHLSDSNVIKYDLEYLRSPTFSKNLGILSGSIAVLIFGKSAFFNKKMSTSNQYKLN